MEHFPTMRPLEYYDVSIETGFLPSTPPLRRLPDAYFEPWEAMMEDFNGLLLAGKLREKIHKVKKKKKCFTRTFKKLNSLPDAFIGP